MGGHDRAGGGSYSALNGEDHIDDQASEVREERHSIRWSMLLVLLFLSGCILLSIHDGQAQRMMGGISTSVMWNTSLATGKVVQQTYDMKAAKVWPDWVPALEKDQGFLQSDYAGRKAEPEVRDRIARLLAQNFPYDVQKPFPKLIWQTWKTALYSGSGMDADKRIWADNWRNNNPSYKYELVTDAMAERIVYLHYRNVPQVIEAYASLPHMILKADFFRYLVLYALGGVYSDVDTYTLKPIDKWFETITDSKEYGLNEPTNKRKPYGLLVGIEADSIGREDWSKWYAREMQICQWTIMSKPGHPVLRNTIAAIVQDTMRMKEAGILDQGRIDTNVLNFTGPARWTDETVEYVSCVACSDPLHRFRHRRFTSADLTAFQVALFHLKRPKQIQDVLFLPATSFSPGFGSIAGDSSHPLAFVFHNFVGSWKGSVGGMEPLNPNP